MSGASSQEVVRSAVPIADLSIVDSALKADGAALKKALRKVRPADVGRDLSRRSLAEGRRLLESSDDRRAGATLRAAHPSIAGRLLATCNPGHAGRLLGFMPTDVQATMLGVLERDERERIEQTLDPKHKSDLDRILAHPPTAVGRLMTPTVWRCEHTETAGDALAHLRAHHEKIEVAQNCYVVDDGAAGRGRASAGARDAPPETPLSELMTRDVHRRVRATPRRAMRRRSSRLTTSCRSR